MAKKAKETPVDKKDELLTIGQKKTKVNVTNDTSAKKESIFISTEGDSRIERTIKVNQPTNGLEEKIIVNSEPIVEKLVLPIIPETVVYEVTFQKNTTEKVIYTKSLPIITDKYLLSLINVFGRSDLKETILGKREIKISCILPLESTDLTVDMRGGLLIKVVSEADWMNREYNDTKKLFDEAVLKVYREMAAQGVTTTPGHINATQQAQGRKRVQAPNDDDDFPAGNIPVRRGMINF